MFACGCFLAGFGAAVADKVVSQVAYVACDDGLAAVERLK